MEASGARGGWDERDSEREIRCDEQGGGDSLCCVFLVFLVIVYIFWHGFRYHVILTLLGGKA